MGLRHHAWSAVRVGVRLLVPPVLAAGIVAPVWFWDSENVLGVLRSPVGVATVAVGAVVAAVCLAVRLCTGSELAGWYAEAALPAAALCVVLLPLADAPAPDTSGPAGSPSPQSSHSSRSNSAGRSDQATGQADHSNQAGAASRTAPPGHLAPPAESGVRGQATRPPDILTRVAATRALPGQRADLAGVVGRSVRGSVHLVRTGTRTRPVVEIHDLLGWPPSTRLDVYLVPGSEGQRLRRTHLGPARAGRSVQAYTLPRGVRLTGPTTVLLWQADPGALVATATVAVPRTETHSRLSSAGEGKQSPVSANTKGSLG